MGLIRVAETGEPKVRLAKRVRERRPERHDHLHTARPLLLGYDPMDYLTGWGNGAIACWPKGEAPGAPTAS